MVNYANGKIYKIECLTTGLIYVGSTTKERLSQRMVEHRKKYKRHLKGKYPYTTSFKVLENDNYITGLLESVNCNTKDELYAREGFYIKTLNCVNKHMMGRTRQEYRQDNKEQIQEQRKQYYQNNIEHKKEYDKQYRETKNEQIKKRQSEKFICECGCQYSYSAKARHIKSIRHQNFVNSQI